MRRSDLKNSSRCWTATANARTFEIARRLDVQPDTIRIYIRNTIRTYIAVVQEPARD